MPLFQPDDIKETFNEREVHAAQIVDVVFNKATYSGVFYTGGHYSLIDLVCMFLKRINGKVLISTYTMNNECAEKLCSMATELKIVADNRQLAHNPDVDEIIRNNKAHIQYSSNHSKITIIETVDYIISISGSANYNLNERQERIEININNVIAYKDFNFLSNEFKQ